MSKVGKYQEQDLMSDLICENYTMLLVLSRFGISLGFGYKTIQEVCRDSNVDTRTFLAVVNLLINENRQAETEGISIPALLTYLRDSHNYFLNFRLPSIRQQLIEATKAENNDISMLIIRYFDEYAEEVKKHMMYEEEKVFPYIEQILAGGKSKYDINIFSRQHDNIDQKLSELKNIIIKYFPVKNTNTLNSVLFDIFSCSHDLASHNDVEDYLLVPSIRKKIDAEKCTDEKQELSDREKEILVCVVKGMTNKAIADALFLSVNTVITHRRNISSKLQIHSTAGLTIYAILNKLVELSDLE